MNGGEPRGKRRVHSGERIIMFTSYLPVQTGLHATLGAGTELIVAVS